ncbi:MAG: cytochrome c [Actinobacteria bacterium]|nr:cytochrome c [Actinomycetota bacterium]MBV8480236.1 cytochrome c [Actinomycetota bacterium]
MTEPAPAAPSLGTRSTRWLAVPLLAFALVSLTAGLLARHSPRSKGYFRLFFSDPVHLKAGFATAAVALACFQLFSAAWIFRKLPWPRPRWIGRAHRWSGRLAFAFTLPVAYHCIFKLGFQDPDTRVLAHSLLGCAVYGAFAAKVTIVRLHRFQRWVLPVAGALLFSVLVGVWYTSALWLYQHTTSAAPAYAVPSPIPASANAAAGAAVFKTAGCAGCHTLAAAHAGGQIGPNLDTLKPNYAQVLAQVTNGGGGMPSFAKTLTAAQIRNVAAYVASNAGG